MPRVAQAGNIIVLAIGDLIAYFFALIIALGIRYLEIPSRTLIESHLASFTILFIVFFLINYGAGLYNKPTLLMRGRIPSLLIKAQIVNILIGAAFFYLAPVGIAPKANLFLYAIFSTALLYLWRLVMYPVVSAVKNQRAVLVGQGEDIDDIYNEVNGHAQYGITFVERVNINNKTTENIVDLISGAVKRSGASVIVANLNDQEISAASPYLYSLIFSGVQIIDASKLYETVFDRIPLSLISEKWFVEYASASAGPRAFDILKRSFDMVFAVFVGVISLVIYPFVYVAIKLEDRGPIFIKQERVGKNGKTVNIYKFRSMSSVNGVGHDDRGAYVNGGKSEMIVTRVGKVIRLTRIDELPQLWNVLKGDLSIVGPRPELPKLVAIYEKEIPHYNVRHLIKPGLSGWAQIYHSAHPHHAVAVEDTRDKLSYDLYYVKNRSITLDIRIALQTLRALLSRRGV